MLILLEMAFAAWLGYLVWRLWRQGWARTLASGVMLLIAVLASTLFFALAQRLAPALTGNLLAGAIGMVAVGLGSFYLAGWLLRRHGKRHGYVQRLEKKLAPKSRRGKFLNGAMIAALLLAILIFLDLMVNLLGAGPMRQRLANRTLVLRYLLTDLPGIELPVDGPGAVAGPETLATGVEITGPAPEFPAGSPEPPVVEPPPTPADGSAVPEAPAGPGLFGMLGDSIRRGRELISDKTGMRDTIVFMVGVQELANASAEEQEYLIKNDPALADLLDNPALHAIIADEQLMKDVDAVGAGSLPALYRLAENPNIKALFADQDFARARQQVDVDELRRKLADYRRQQSKSPADTAPATDPPPADAPDPAPSTATAP